MRGSRGQAPRGAPISQVSCRCVQVPPGLSVEVLDLHTHTEWRTVVRVLRLNVCRLGMLLQTSPVYCLRAAQPLPSTPAHNSSRPNPNPTCHSSASTLPRPLPPSLPPFSLPPHQLKILDLQLAAEALPAARHHAYLGLAAALRLQALSQPAGMGWGGVGRGWWLGERVGSARSAVGAVSKCFRAPDSGIANNI